MNIKSYQKVTFWFATTIQFHFTFPVTKTRLLVAMSKVKSKNKHALHNQIHAVCAHQPYLDFPYTIIYQFVRKCMVSKPRVSLFKSSYYTLTTGQTTIRKIFMQAMQQGIFLLGTFPPKFANDYMNQEIHGIGTGDISNGNLQNRARLKLLTASYFIH